MKTFKELREHMDLEEAIRPNDILITMKPKMHDPSRLTPSWNVNDKSIFKDLKKLVSPDIKKALDGGYMDGQELVHKSGKTIATIKPDQKMSDFVKAVEAGAKQYVPAKKTAAADGIKVDGPTRAIVDADDSFAQEIKSKVHNTKAGIKVRIMKRSSGNKVYIDTKDDAGLQAALKQVRDMM